MSKKTKILYIAGWGRSGSTMLSSVLGSAPGFFAAGEMAFAWPVFNHAEWHCTCRQPLLECEIWRQIIQRTFGRIAPEDIIKMQQGLHQLLNKRRYGARALLGKPLAADKEGAFAADHLGAFYAAIQAVTGARVIIDSSKVPIYAAWLQQEPSLDVHIIHLLRDPRAVAFSWSKAKGNMSGTGLFKIPRKSTIQSALRWTAVNLAFDRMSRNLGNKYMRFRYKDFLAEPHAHIEKVFSFLDEAGTPDPVNSDQSVNLAPMHIAFGNPSRMLQGQIQLAVRNEWMTQMPKLDQRIVTAICAPLMHKYGYLFSQNSYKAKTNGS